MKYFYMLVSACLVVGCTVSLDGRHHAVGAGESAEYRHATQERLLVREQEERMRGLARTLVRRAAPPYALVVGDTGALAPYGAALRRRLYHDLVGEMARRSPNKTVSLDEQAFVRQLAGWSTIETFGIGGFIRDDQPLAVGAADVLETGFAARPDALLRGATGDLVAARANADGLLVLDRVLCRRTAPDYRACAARHVRGRFDARTGAELDGDWRPKHDGRRVDTGSYLAAA